MPKEKKTLLAEPRDISLLATDKSALNAIVQAAVNVELFTIPLYMTSLYSLHGTHRINGQNDFYQGRLWPGMGTSANPKTGNEKAFNAIFSVFIAEMLHLQLASNMCKAMGVIPTYTSAALQNNRFGWTCYGKTNTVIPHILDLKDTTTYGKVTVSLGPVDKNQVDLFLAIEETENDFNKIIKNKKKYEVSVPFADWTPSKTEADLPLFGTIGNMYKCMFEYMTIKYSDGTTLWDHVFATGSLQRDIFNANTPGSHAPEYPKMSATITADAQDQALMQIIDMINGITDQGEGSGVVPMLKAIAAPLIKNTVLRSSFMLLKSEVKSNFQPDAKALEEDYPSYTDKGVKEPKSRDAAARVKYGKIDHYATFAEVKELLDSKQLLTWDQWHAKKGNVWTADMLKSTGYEQNTYPLPKADEIAGALNRLKENNGEKNFVMFSQVVAGAIKGVTTVLNDYWNGKTATFPFPSMGGSGDRMSLCWAIFGKAPDLAIGVTPKKPGILYHSCQGLNLDANNATNPASCAAMEVFHTCKGSNTCAAEGGCGFVQSVQGGGSCSSSAKVSGGGAQAGCSAAGCGAPKAAQAPSGCGAPNAVPAPSGCGSKAKMLSMTSKGNTGATPVHSAGGGCGQPSGNGTCGAPTPSCSAPAYYSAPSDNRCMSYGGCAVPISASQIFPSPDGNLPGGQMELFDFVGTQFQPTSINTMAYNAGDMVYDVAWDAYIAVLQAKKRPIPAKPKPSDIRLAFPPST